MLPVLIVFGRGCCGLSTLLLYILRHDTLEALRGSRKVRHGLARALLILALFVFAVDTQINLGKVRHVFSEALLVRYGLHVLVERAPAYFYRTVVAAAVFVGGLHEFVELGRVVLPGADALTLELVLYLAALQLQLLIVYAEIGVGAQVRALIFAKFGPQRIEAQAEATFVIVAAEEPIVLVEVLVQLLIVRAAAREQSVESILRVQRLEL